jgi:maleate isomerase
MTMRASSRSAASDAALSRIAVALLRETAASRTTIRLAAEKAGDFPVAVEALGPNVPSLKGQPVVRRPADNPGPLEYLETEKRILVQDDVTTSPPAFPEIVHVYGVNAQMLAPVLRAAEFVGLVSVHSITARKWTPADVAALERAAAAVSAIVGEEVDR